MCGYKKPVLHRTPAPPAAVKAANADSHLLCDGSGVLRHAEADGPRDAITQAQEHDMKSGGQKGLWKKGGKKPFSRRN